VVPPAATGSAYGHALVLNDRIGARPWVARTQEEYARLLFASDDAGDRENAERLLAARSPRTVSSGWRPGPSEPKPSP